MGIEKRVQASHTISDFHLGVGVALGDILYAANDLRHDGRIVRPTVGKCK